MRNLIKLFLNGTVAFTILCGASVTANAATETGSKKSFGYSNLYGKVTPTQVYSLLQNYESLFVYYVQNHKNSLSGRANALKLQAVTGKTPEDAFVRVLKLSDLLAKLARNTQLKPTDKITRQKKKAIPAEVFLQVGNNLDALAHIMNKLEPGKSWGGYYSDQTYKKAKTPNDVYALADLSVRRFNLVLR